MLCAISGEAPEEPVVSKKTGTVFEKRLIEKYIGENGKDPITGDELDLEDLLPIKSARVVKPRPPTLTSIPALLSTFQNEWDALALETFKLKQQLSQTRDELANALYQHDAAVRVIARLTKERDEARDSLSRITVSAGAGAGANGDEMAVDNEALPEELSAHVDETQAKLSKSRKKRPVPSGWASSEEIATFAPQTSEALPVPQTSSLDTEAGYAAVGGLQGDVAIFSIASGSLERNFKVDEPITDTVWHGSKIMFATSKGSVKVIENGDEIASFSDHAGAATALSLHPGGNLLASVGTDKSFVFYDLTALKRVTRVFSSAALTACAFHPDGHLFAAGTNTGDIKMFLTKTGEEAATFTLGAPVEALIFSENGYWIAATAKGQTTVTVFDLRKEGDAAKVKVLDIGSSVQSLAWDYTGQYLATAGPSGVTVQQYSKGRKSWSELLQSATPAVALSWGEEAKKLITANGDGVISVLSAPETS
ncbi:Pre-mRNA-processing factor 19 [Cytospora mali]|uniref:Pre-mRNA-processing factor 19 n=1 Tax=Cytospora mali TaxID=578113 RepID=A0A194VMR6_CYTMA|nr:Pre-mRNA-processing factor 19 [Valsa mali]